MCRRMIGITTDVSLLHLQFHPVSLGKVQSTLRNVRVLY